MDASERKSSGSDARSPSDPPKSSGLRLKGLLLLLTALSIFLTHFQVEGTTLLGAIGGASSFTGTLLLILLAHEGGHYLTARIHRVPASLPYFLPLPILSPFGTMGAVIQLDAPISSRRALFDIAAAGPLAGLVVALPLYAVGVHHSTTVPLVLDPAKPQVELGESLAIRALDHIFGPAVPAGHEIMLSPTAFAAWAGLFLTMVNLLPLWELDGGHVAYALLGERQNRLQRHVHALLLLMFAASLGTAILHDVQSGFGLRHFDRIAQNSMFWLFWFEVLAILASKGGPKDLGRGQRAFALLGIFGLAQLGSLGPRVGLPFVLYWGAWLASIAMLLTFEILRGALHAKDHFSHPTTNRERIGALRAGLGVLVMSLFVLLFMPTPMAIQ